MKNSEKRSFKIIEEGLSANQLSDMEMVSVVGAANLMCGADACGGATCGAFLGCIGNACGGNACGGNACGGNACGIQLCAFDACMIDACAIDLFVLSPAIQTSAITPTVTIAIPTNISGSGVLARSDAVGSRRF